MFDSARIAPFLLTFAVIMAPSRRKGARKAAAAAAAAACRQWKVGDLVLAKVKGFPAWPATVGAT